MVKLFVYLGTNHIYMAIEQMKKSGDPESELAKAKGTLNKQLAFSSPVKKKERYIAKAMERESDKPHRMPSEDFDPELRAKNARNRYNFHRDELKRLDDYVDSRKEPYHLNYNAAANVRLGAAERVRKALIERNDAASELDAIRNKRMEGKKMPADFDYKKDIPVPERGVDSKEDLDYWFDGVGKNTHHGYNTKDTYNKIGERFKK